MVAGTDDRFSQRYPVAQARTLVRTLVATDVHPAGPAQYQELLPPDPYGLEAALGKLSRLCELFETPATH
jgi:hypothetical protein